MFIDKTHISKTGEALIKIAAVVAAIGAIAGGYSFWKNNIWNPKITVVSVDYAKGVAVVKSFGKEISIFGDATFLIGGDWGIKFGSNRGVYDKLELTKKGMVVDYLTA